MSIEDSRQGALVCKADVEVLEPGQRNLRVPAGPHVRQQVQTGLPRVALIFFLAAMRSDGGQ